MKAFAVFVAFVAVTLAAFECSPRRTITVLIEEDGSDSYEFVKCDASEADAVFVIEITKPGHWRPDIHCFELKRNPNAPRRGFDWINCSWAACGGLGGENGSISAVPEDDGQQVHVSASISWTTKEGRKGEASGDLHAPWLGGGTQEFGNGGTLRVRCVEIVRETHVESH